MTKAPDRSFADAQVLITGGLGFIGSNLAHRLVAAGAQVTLVDSLIPEYGGNLFNVSAISGRVHVNIADVRDPHSMRQLVRDQDYLFNLAGQTSHLDSMNDPYVDLDINCRAQLSILEACRHRNPEIRVVFASTRQIYGKPDYLPVDEQHLVRPVDVNGINKMAGEWYHILYNNCFDLRASALRLTNTYGPRMRIRDARQTFLGIWIKLLLQNQPVEVWGGDQKRDVTYVDDAGDALMLAATSEAAYGKVFNVGGDRTVTLTELAKLAIAANGGQGELVVREFPAQRKQIDIGDYYADDRLLRQTLGWSPKVSLETGLQRTLDFYRRELEHYV